jgi:4-alpha-glucanotransferase
VRLPRLSERGAGVLLHPTSLPGPGPRGNIGSRARQFVDFLAAAGQRWWQMLPVGPPGYGGSPYSALSAFAGAEELISPERLAEDGLVKRADTVTPRLEAVRAARANFRDRGGPEREAFDAFCEANREWLDDFALFRALKRAHGDLQWTLWPPPLRDRQPAGLEVARRRLADEIDLHRFEQFRFDEDWAALRRHCARRGIGLMGDIPIFVAHDSADVWQHRELFHLDPAGEPALVAGVPPDYFSTTGQRWGNPLYNWPRLRQSGYHWWIERFRAALARFDAVRLDHFIGFVRYWQIPAAKPTAASGKWVRGPGAGLFLALRAALGELPLIAENLGVVTPAVERLRRRLGLPGIRVLQFGFGSDSQSSQFLPHNYRRRTVAYTGTHDNDTTVGWFGDPGSPDHGRSPEQTERERRAALTYLGLDAGSGSGATGDIHWAMIRALHASPANLAMVPMQDLLGLGSQARMNHPGRAEGNWTWRMDEGALTPGLAARLREMTRTYGRTSVETDAR